MEEDRISNPLMFRRSFLLVTSLAPLLLGAKKSQSKGPEIQLLESSGKVENGKIAIDGRAKNLSDRALRKLTVIYDMLDSDKNVLSTQKGEVEQEELPVGEESAFHAKMGFPPRAVSFRLNFEEIGERELRSAKFGPFPIQ